MPYDRLNFHKSVVKETVSTSHPTVVYAALSDGTVCHQRIVEALFTSLPATPGKPATSLPANATRDTPTNNELEEGQRRNRSRSHIPCVTTSYSIYMPMLKAFHKLPQSPIRYLDCPIRRYRRPVQSNLKYFNQVNPHRTLGSREMTTWCPYSAIKTTMVLRDLTGN